jgi:hypothetical protein
MYYTIKQIEEANRAAGQHFFAPDTMRFFNSRVLSGVYGGRYFVTSEKGPDGVRAYTVRECLENGHVETVGEFQEYATPRAAIRAAEQMP